MTAESTPPEMPQSTRSPPVRSRIVAAASSEVAGHRPIAAGATRPVEEVVERSPRPRRCARPRGGIGCRTADASRVLESDHVRVRGARRHGEAGRRRGDVVAVAHPDRLPRLEPGEERARHDDLDLGAAVLAARGRLDASHPEREPAPACRSRCRAAGLRARAARRSLGPRRRRRRSAAHPRGRRRWVPAAGSPRPADRRGGPRSRRGSRAPAERSAG